MGEIEHNVTQAELAEARALTRRGTRGVIPALMLIIGLASMGGGALVAAVLGTSGILETAIVCGIAGALVGLPLILGVSLFTVKRGRQMSIETIVRERVLEGEARRREFQTRLARALEMSDDEEAAFDVIGRAMRTVAPEAPIELLLADNSHAHLEQAVASSDFVGCAVDSPDRCVAARRAQTQVFADSEDLDACPMLRGRDAAAARASASPSRSWVAPWVSCTPPVESVSRSTTTPSPRCRRSRTRPATASACSA